jgi:hypothetical protein
MAENDDGDYRFTLMEQVFGKWATIAKGNPPEPHEVWADVLPHKTEIDVDVNLADVSDMLQLTVLPIATSVSQRSPPEALNAESSEGVKRQKELKTAVELAKMIEADLARHPDCPEAGFRVTVYGWPHWRAMLTITPAAGRVRNPQEWRDLTYDLTDRLRKHYDLVL